MIRFSELFSKAGVAPDHIEGDADVVTLVMDSRKAVPGCCFVCMPSESTDSHSYLPAAKGGGATAAIVHSEDGFAKARELGMVAALISPSLLPGEKGQGDEGWPSMQEQETPEQRIRRTTGRFSEAMWRLAKVASDDPSSKLKVIGVTGTNGKTTTAWLIRDMLNLLGVPCAYIGTLGFGLPTLEGGLPIGERAESTIHNPQSAIQEELRHLSNTTPFSIELNAMLAECVERGCQAVAMEVSSHALAERRADGIDFDVAVFTNLTQDHLDYHGTMESYEAAKWRLFSELDRLTASRLAEASKPGRMKSGLTAVIQVHDTVGWRWACSNADEWPAVWRFASVPKLGSFGQVNEGLDLEGCAFDVGIGRIHAAFQARDDGDCGLWAGLGGSYNVENLTAAVAAVHSMGYSLFEITTASTELLRPVPGRFEPVPNDSGIGIIVDYAHTPDALEKLLATVRPLTKGKVITVFGCGGDRDKSKRPLMARAAQEGSDIVVVTSDNPRTEDPNQIIEDILAGISDCGLPNVGDRAHHNPQSTIHIHVDRPEAVAFAIQLAEPGDTVVIAGKGHENYQIIGRTKYDMDDRELARAGLALR